MRSPARTPRFPARASAASSTKPGRAAVAVPAMLLAAGLHFLAPHARAASALGTSIAAVGGAVVEVPTSTILALGDLQQGNYASATQIRVFRERVDHLLAANTTVSITASGIYGAPLTPGIIPAGTSVTSYLVHFDPNTPGGVILSGTIDFEQDILGIIVGAAGLTPTDAAPGLGITYDANPNRGADLGALNPDVVTFTSPRHVALTLANAIGVDEIRILVKADGPGVSFSFDWQSPSYGAAGSFGGNVRSGDLLTVGAGGAPGPNPPMPITGAPGLMVFGTSLGITATGAGIREIDAFSYGRDSGSRLRFSVDEWAGGAAGGAAPDVRSESTVGHESSSDLFRYQAPFAPPAAAGVVFGNRLTNDGAGAAGTPGFGLVEPNAWAVGWPDAGDNLDEIDLGTIASDIDGWVFFSLESNLADPAEGFPGSGSAQANLVSGADILVNRRSVPPNPPTAPAIYATYTQLGLQQTDDIDALILNDPAGAVLEQTPTYGGAGTGGILYFSLRRGSPSLMNPAILDKRYGLMLTEADVLEPTAAGVAIVVPGEAMGLLTARVGGGYPSGTADDLDGMDLTYPKNFPAAAADQANVPQGGHAALPVLANDSAPYGAIDPASIRIVRPPLHGNLALFPLLDYQHDGSATTTDSFSYIVADTDGEVSERTEVTLSISATTAVEAAGPSSLSLRLVGRNPSPQGTSLAFSVPKAGPAELSIFDAQGRRVRNLFAGELPAGSQQQAVWDGRDDSGRAAGAGIFFARLSAVEGVKTLRVVRLP